MWLLEPRPTNRPEPRRKERKADFGYIWPKDPMPGNPSRWSRWQRFTDVMTGKGPDMHVGRIGPRASHYGHGHAVDIRDSLRSPWNRKQKSRTDWSLWENEHIKYCTTHHCLDCYNVRKREKSDNILRGARRGPEERYDFRTRRYQIPDEATWSKVVYCDERRHSIPILYLDRLGDEYPAGHYHDAVYGAHGIRCW